VDTGPRYTGQVMSNGTFILLFDEVHAGLVSSDGQPLRHFEIAGEDRTFVAATAVIAGDTVHVSAPSVTEPVAVRYGWEMNIDVNFFNADGLPACPFRTDDWMAAPGRVIRVACIGDSITYGATIPNRSVDSYPAQLQKILGTADFEVRNFGKSGAGVYRPRNKYDSSAEHADALAYNPDIVICNLGINDITAFGTYTREDFIGEYRDLVDAYASLATDPVFIHWHKLAPLFPGQPFYGDPNLVTLQGWIADSAGVTGARTMDMYEPLRGHPEWFPDHIHPNAAGAREVAEATFRFLADLETPHGKPGFTGLTKGRDSI
jgi:lysophospholipase L1-like esterase